MRVTGKCYQSCLGWPAFLLAMVIAIFSFPILCPRAGLTTTRETKSGQCQLVCVRLRVRFECSHQYRSHRDCCCCCSMSGMVF